MMVPRQLAGLALLAAAAQAAQVWTVRVEEPTGLYRRTAEVARVPLARLGDNRGGFTVTDAAGRELPWQVSGDALLFPVSLIPGELPEYRVWCCDAPAAPRFKNEIAVRRVGMHRLELANARFRVMIDLRAGAIVEAYSLAAAAPRMLNLVETSPESEAAMKGDIHPNAYQPFPKVAGVEEENAGWTSLGGSGPFTGVELLGTGPLEGRVRLARAGETWELFFTAGSPALRWRAGRGFKFLSVSAAPYLPFDRCVDGSEYNWPTGPGEEEPQPHGIEPRQWSAPPGGHFVYYRYAEDYGALGIVALDAGLRWRGACSRRFIAEKPQGGAEIALTFPRWRERETVLEARQENRILRQPVLVQVSAASEAQRGDIAPAPREHEYAVETGRKQATPFRGDALPLDGEWELMWAEKGAGPPAAGWRKVQVPGSVHLQWLPKEKVYTREAEWLSGKEWWYRRTFTAPERFRARRLMLEFEATDYYADVYINGQYAGRHEGYIDPWRLDVSKLIQPGAPNEIQVRVWTPVYYYWKHRSYTVKGSYGAVDQKPDDITALGITRPLRLAAYQPAVLTGVAVDTRLTGAKSAEVGVALEAAGFEPEVNYTWEVTLSPRNFQGAAHQIKLVANEPAPKFVIPVPDAQLWWTWDHGKPNLYTLDVRLLDASGRAIDARTLAVGIREIEQVGWDFYLNRRRMFIRGTNYYYNLFLSEMSRSRYERDVQLMRGMNINAIRVHCHFSSPELYDLADEQGILIWQDYLESWQPHDTAFSQRAALLYDQHIRYVRNHPSIMAWATSDEEDLENYRDLTKHLAARPATLDPQRRTVVRSSGRFGDAHVYHGWYGGSIWQYTQMDQAFVTELGATALPNYETLRKFMSGMWPIRDHADEWTWRRLQIPEAMRAWGDPGGLSMQDYIPQTQRYVGRLFQIAIERMRQRKSEGAGGIFHFHAIDIWPSVTMAAIGIDRVPTKVYDVVRRSFAPVAATFQYTQDRWKSGEPFACKIWAINDRWEAVNGAAVRWRVRSANGKTFAQGQWPVVLAADSAALLGSAEWTAGAPGAYQLVAEVRDSSGRISENIFDFQVIDK